MALSNSLKVFAYKIRSLLYVEQRETVPEKAKRWAAKLWNAHPWLKDLLCSADNLEVAREQLYAKMVARERAIRDQKLDVHPLEWAIIRDSSRVIRNVLSKRCEEMAGFSSLECLWNIANERWKALPDGIKPGFFEEFHRILLAVQGQSGIYERQMPPASSKLEGRKAALARSDELDALAAHAERRIRSYPTGLDDEVILRRRINRKRIMKILKCSESEWHNWKWQIRNVIRDEKMLGRLIKLTQAERKAINLAKKHHIPFGITPYYCSLMDKETHRRNDHAVRAQVIPGLHYVESMVEYRKIGMHSADFMLECDTSPIDTVVRRYPRVAIFKPFNTCAQICVYCQRNWEVQDVLCPHAMAPKSKIEAAIAWFSRHTHVREVLITGGDAFIMNDDTIEYLLRRLTRLSHIERIRFGTRTPVVLPSRISKNLISILRKYHNMPSLDITVVTHFEHAYEVTPEAFDVVESLRTAGINVYNQMVFTVDNSRRFEAVATRIALKKIGVEPYYTFIMKGKKETDEMRAPVARALQEQKEEDRLMPGTIRTDETVYNVPRLGKNYVRAGQHHDFIMIMPNGSRMLEFHPWEKNLSLAGVYVDCDVPIYDYLIELARRGEDIKDYESIWYYY